MMIFDMSCALEIPEASVGRFSLCFVYFVLFCLFRFARGLAKAKCGEFDMSIFIRIS